MRDIKTYNIDVQTLTYLHIGDGAQLTSSEWTTYREDGEAYIAVVDPEKVLKIIGKNRMGQYVSAIDKGENIADFMKRCVSGTPVTEYMRRSMWVVKGVPKNESTIKTCIHDGMGYPYLPGSSVKGAVRTALLDYLLRGSDIYQKPTLEIKPKLVEDYEKRYLGSMEKDVFHFVRFFDARFEYDTEVALNEYNLNIREKSSLIDTSKSAWVEAIDVDQDASMRMQIDVGGLKSSDCTKAATELMSVQKLFSVINKHTIALLADDIKFWNSVSGNGKDDADDYIKNLREVLRQAKACGEGECVMRVGHGSGWRFTTGGWAEQFEDDNQWNAVVNLARPNNARKYSDYPFPKSRRIGGFDDPLGFIKLKVNNG